MIMNNIPYKETLYGDELAATSHLVLQILITRLQDSSSFKGRN